jgi:hypothetical protein
MEDVELKRMHIRQIFLRLNLADLLRSAHVFAKVKKQEGCPHVGSAVLNWLRNWDASSLLLRDVSAFSGAAK